MLEERIAQLLVNSADEVIVLGIASLLLFKLLRYALQRYFDYLEQQTPLITRGVEAVEKVAESIQHFEQQVTNELNLVRVSVRALWDEWEYAKQRAEDERRARAEEPAARSAA